MFSKLMFTLCVVATLSFKLSKSVYPNHKSGAPKLESSLPDISEATLGHEMTLRCVASGRPLPEIYWLIDGQLFDFQIKDKDLETENKDNLYIGETVSIFRIPCISSIYHRANIACRAVNQNGESDFAKTTIFVGDNKDLSVNDIDREHKCKFNDMVRAPIITEWTKYMLELQHNEVRLRCRSPEADSITWSHSSGLPVSGSNFEVLDNGDLIIKDLQRANMGKFICRASNTYGYDQKSTFVYPTAPQ